jgi:Holliday junction resolvasome RuvABC DNA-binding subunit
MLKPKRISNIEILYDKKSAKTNTQKVVKETTLADLGQCVKILVGYGFKASEAKTIVAEAHASNPTSDTASLIKNILVTIGGKNG